MSREIERLRAIAASDYSVDRTLTAGEAQALLSRLDTLSETISGRFETVADERNHYMLRAADAEAQVEALTEALREIALIKPDLFVTRDNVERALKAVDIAREALSRVSRSEPNCPECGSGLLNGEHIAKYECSRRSEPAPPNDVCSWCDMHGVCDPGNCPMRPASPVPEEQ